MGIVRKYTVAVACVAPAEKKNRRTKIVYSKIIVGELLYNLRSKRR